MKLLTKTLEKQLIANKGKENAMPVVKFFGGSAATWLLTEYDPETDLFFGLCDLGFGEPELGYVSKADLEEVRFPPFGLPVERDIYFKADKTITQYYKEAKASGRVLA